MLDRVRGHSAPTGEQVGSSASNKSFYIPELETTRLSDKANSEVETKSGRHLVGTAALTLEANGRNEAWDVRYDSISQEYDRLQYNVIYFWHDTILLYSDKSFYIFLANETSILNTIWSFSIS